MEKYYIGQIFRNEYPADAADWCGENNAYIEEIEPQEGVRIFEIKEQDPPAPIDVDKLRMTALDFIGVLQSFGLTLEQINTYLENNLSVKTQLTYCQNVYCGVAKALMPIEYEGITITAEMVEDAFKKKGL